MRLELIKDSNNMQFEGKEEKARREFKLRQPTLSWPARRDEERAEDKRMEYCEERRRDNRRNQEEEIERKKEAGRRTAQWELFSVPFSVEFLRKNERKWRTR